MEAIVITNSSDETKALGRHISANLTGKENLFLVGGLGAGKTVLTQGIGEGMGVKRHVKSPTYVYLQEYDVPYRSTRLAHYDLYRLPDELGEDDVRTIDLTDRLQDKDTVTIVEWGDKLKLANTDASIVTFHLLSDGRRQINVPKKLLRRRPA